MKKYISLFSLAAVMVALTTSCDKDTEGVTGITYYPEYILNGDAQMVITAGQAWNDPGCTAYLNGEDITDLIEVITDLDFADPQPGFYPVLYSYTNADGFTNSISRDVIVSTGDDDASGFYTVQTDSHRLYNGATTYYGGYAITIYGDGTGTYEVDDMLGGWYWQRAGYGTRYAMQGIITVAADGSISLVDSYLAGWGDSLTDLTDGHFDAATGTITWNVEYTDYPFNFIVNAVRN